MTLKQFIKLYVLLFFIEIILVVCDALASNFNWTIFDVQFHKFSGLIVSLFSLPISLLRRDYPFYADSIGLGIILFMINLVFHTIVIYYVRKFLRDKMQ